MIRNYFRIALRQLLKYRSSVSINILGLAFGLACCMMCYVHLRYQYSFDNFHENKDRLYRIVNGDPATSQSWVKTAAPMPAKLKDVVPEIESYARFNNVSWNEKVAVATAGQVFFESSFVMTDPAFFTMFDYPLVKGNAESVLAELNSVVITESIARKLFGDNDPIGRVITLNDNKLDFEVTGVMKDLPANTHLRADYLISFANLDRIVGAGASERWGAFNYFCYVQLANGTRVEDAISKIKAVSIELPDSESLSLSEVTLQPVTDIHFQHSRGNMKPSYDPKYLYIFMALAVSVLVITIMNYFNLATMLSLRRFREIGVRKSIGATTTQISSQFISENVGTTLVSLILGIILLQALSPVAAWILGYKFVIPYSDPVFLAAFLAIAILLGLLSGSYLSYFIAAGKPGSVLKGRSSGQGKNTIQYVLIFVQFALSLGLITSSLVISRQMQYISDKDLGFDQDKVITISLSRDLTPTQIKSLKEELRKMQDVAAVASSDFTPGRANWNQTVWWEGQTEPQSMFIMAVDQEFIPAMNINFLEGSPADLQSEAQLTYVINEAASEAIGWTESRGKMISPFGEERKSAVAAVVKDFNFSSLHNAVEPLVLVLYKEKNFSRLSVRLAPGSVSAQIEKVEDTYRTVAGAQPFEFSFMDESIAQLYQAENQMNAIVLLLTIVAVAFALLGIYALISFSIENRTKEIAIRKVLGVSPASLVSLFSGVYLKIAALSAVVTIPICGFFLKTWLEKFSYKIDLSPIWFAAAIILVGVSIVVIAVIKYASIQRINPARSLKYE